MARIIERSKQRIGIMLPGFIITGLVAILMLLLGFGILPTAGNVEIHPLVIGLFALVLLSSAYFVYLAIQKLNDKSPGLAADDEGLSYNISPLGKAVGKIRWTDINGFKEDEEIFITVMVKNPQYYLKRIANRRLQNHVHSHAITGKPGALLPISSHGLSCDYDELKIWLDNRLAEHTENSTEA